MAPAVSVEPSFARSGAMMSRALSGVTPVWTRIVWPKVTMSIPSVSHLAASPMKVLTDSFRYSMRCVPFGVSVACMLALTSMPKMKLSPLLSSSWLMVSVLSLICGTSARESRTAPAKLPGGAR